ncbi:MAG: imidazole glycerol phosphate synthase subunit HisH [Candidatus Omnitrophica bacterium]|nr:imidazole glycerol phosphate synthase subunit HisH [Candidatus Omnitrophota bacterium]
MIAIIDYGSGNLRSVYNAFKYLKAGVVVTDEPASLVKADKIVLPGVGSSKDAMRGLAERGLIGALKESIAGGKPFLGICLGLQLLFEKSQEGSGTECLGVLKGDVRLFPGSEGLKVPEIGWNTVSLKGGGCPVFRGIPDESYFYFVHSYYCVSLDEEISAGKTEYGVRYTSAVWKDNIFAVQFHPERSQSNGIKLLENFIKI